MWAMFDAWSRYADAGYDLVIDHVLLFRERVEKLATVFRAHRVIFIGVFCSSPKEQKRSERHRGDGPLGIARWLWLRRTRTAYLTTFRSILRCSARPLCIEAIFVAGNQLQREYTSFYRIARGEVPR